MTYEYEIRKKAVKFIQQQERKQQLRIFQAIYTLPLFGDVKATSHKDRLMALYVICLHIFRHLAQKLLEIRQYSCVVSIQSDEKSDCASAAQSLCGVALRK